MGLKVHLKPFERMIIGNSLITNCETKATFLVAGNVPILREKDILTPDTANTPIKRIYLCVQMMYLEGDIGKYQDLYFEFVRDLLGAVPRYRAQVEDVSGLILEGSFYKALKELKRMVADEEELLKHV
jgi:flagellar protein FlbT